jgi:hypothetical protein
MSNFRKQRRALDWDGMPMGLQMATMRLMRPEGARRRTSRFSVPVVERSNAPSASCLPSMEEVAWQ